MTVGECPVCGCSYAKPRRAAVAVHREAGYTYLIAPKRRLGMSRRILHECRAERPRPGGTSALVPAIPPRPRPSRENAIALDIPDAEALAG